MAMDARPKLLRYQTLNPGVESGRDAHAWPYLTYLHHSPGLQGALRGALCCIARHKSAEFWVRAMYTYLPTIRPGLHGQ